MLPPSIHPDTGKPYVKVDGPIPVPPGWLTRLMLPERVSTPSTRPSRPARVFAGPSLADQFNSTATWADVLEPHGWRAVFGDGDSDGSRWRHPAATSPTSASVRGGRLYVYSPNTPFEVTEASDPHGHSKFHAYAVLNHGGDMSAAARDLAGKAGTAA